MFEQFVIGFIFVVTIFNGYMIAYLSKSLTSSKEREHRNLEGWKKAQDGWENANDLIRAMMEVTELREDKLTLTKEQKDHFEDQRQILVEEEKSLRKDV